MNCYDHLPCLSPAPIRKAYFTFRSSKEPYTIAYVVAENQVYLSLEHLVALACGKRIQPLIHYSNMLRSGLTSPCWGNLGASPTVFKQCTGEAVKHGAKCIMCDGECYALGIPLSNIRPMLLTLKRALIKDQITPTLDRLKVHQNKIKRTSELFRDHYINLTEAILIDAGLKPKPALAAPVTINARAGDSVPEAGIKRTAEKQAPCRPGSYTAQRVPTYPYFSWLY